MEQVRLEIGDYGKCLFLLKPEDALKVMKLLSGNGIKWIDSGKYERREIQMNMVYDECVVVMPPVIPEVDINSPINF